MRATTICVVSMMMVWCVAASAQVTGNKVASENSSVCSAATTTIVVWRPAAWPSYEFIKRQGINYLGRCDSMAEDLVKGTVTARLADAANAEKIRCKYELAGLGEIRSDQQFFRKVAKRVHESCDAVVSKTTDAALVKSWQWLETAISD